MGRIVVSENVTLDGVVEDPTGEEGSGGGGWFSATGPEDREAWGGLMLDEARRAESLLLGRRSDEWFATRWSARTGPWAERLNAMPKYVVSSTLREPLWGNGTVLAGDVLDEIGEVRRESSGDIVVYGSIRLVHTLMDNDLVDELRLTVYPVVAGTGARLVGAGGDRAPLHLTGTRTVGRDLVHLTYRPVR